MLPTAIITQQVPTKEGSINFVQECIKYKQELTQTVYYNICDGSTVITSLGFWDYILSVSFTIFIALVLVMLAKFTFHIFK